MKVLLVHLSDSHFKSKESIEIIDIGKIIDSLMILKPFEKCCIVYSGDLTFSSTDSEVTLVMNFIKKLSRDIKSKYKLKDWVEIFIVPGNHDLNYNLISRNREDAEVIKNAYIDKAKTEKVEEIFTDDLKGLKNFLNLQRYFNCYCQNDPIVNHRLVEFDSLKIDMCMVNTTPLSLCIKTNEDKLYHHLTEKNLQDIIPKEKADLRMIILHHPIEWFNFDVKEKLQKLVNEYYDVIFIGHEHSYRSEVKNINNETQITYLFADALLDGDKPIGYSVAKLNTEDRRFEEYKYKWNQERKFFEHRNKKDIDTYLKGNASSIHNFHISKKYCEYLEKEPTENLKVDIGQYYVFPKMTYRPDSDIEKDYTISNLDEFINFIKNEKKLVIQGNSNSGRTSLCNLLCKKTAESMVPVVIRGEDVNRGANINNVIMQSFLQMYDNDMSLFHEYEQLDKDKKIIIVDNANVWSNKSKEMVTAYFSSYCDFVVMFSDKEWNFNIIEQTINALKEDNFTQINIEPFYYEYREKLIKNVLSVLDGEANTKDVNYINEFVHNQVKYCPREPEFIIQLVKYYRDCGGGFTDDRQNVFSVVFENDLYNKIREISNNIDTNEIFTAFEEIAYNMHFHKMYPMKYKQMVDIIDNYNEKYDEEVKAKKIHDIAVDAHIFKELDEINTFIFKEKRVFAYFVARSLVKKKHEEVTKNDLNFVLNNMCFGINGDIMLFLAYITREVNILTSILECAKKSTEEWIEFSFNNEEGKLDYLKYVTSKEKINLPQPGEKEKVKKRKGDIEKATLKKDDTTIPEIYNYNENELNSDSNQLVKSVKMLEIVSKMLPNFSGTFISAEFKKECVDLIYSYPNKIIYKLFSDINENFIDNLEKIKEEIPELSENLGGDIDSIAKELATQSVMFIINIYYFTAKLCANKKTLRVLDKHNDDSLTHRLQNTLMHLRDGNLDEFLNKIMYVKKNSDIKELEFILKITAREYIIHNKVDFHGHGQKLISAFFGENTKKLQIDTYKSRVSRKD